MAAGTPGTLTADAAAKQGAVSRLVQIYSNRGHLIANLDPLGMQKRERPRVLELVVLRAHRSGSRYRIPHRLAPDRARAED